LKTLGGTTISKKKILIIAIVVVVAVVAVAGVYLMQSFTASFAEVEDAIKSYITALNNYDLDASWALMSTSLQDFYGSKAEFNSSILSGLEESGWQALLTNISTKEISTINGVTTARFVVTLQITETGLGARGETYTFKLLKTGNQWKIDDWLQGVWD